MGHPAEAGLAVLPAPATADRWTCEHVLSIRYWTPTLLSIRTTRYRGFRFTPGHYARVGIERDNGTVWRPYSVVSASYDAYLEFLAVLVPGGEFSLALSALRVGDPILVEKPSYGFLTLDQLAPGRDLWLLASGSGLGPFVSILREPGAAGAWERFEHVILVHSVRRADELAYREELGALSGDELLARHPARFSYVPIVTREPGATPLSARIPQLLADGRLVSAVGTQLSVENSRLMVCGNPEMARELRALLGERGFATNRRGTLGQMAFEKYW